MLDIHPEQDTHRSVLSDKNIYIFKIFTISSNHETYTEECAHLQSNTEFFYSSNKFIFVPWCQCKILVLSNFFFYKCANKTDLESFSAQCKSPGSSGAVTELSLHLSPALSSLNTAPRCFAFHFQVKCSSSKKPHGMRSVSYSFTTG